MAGRAHEINGGGRSARYARAGTGASLRCRAPKQWIAPSVKGQQPTIVIPWGDVSTAYYSAKIPNIEARVAAPGCRIFPRRIIGTSSCSLCCKPRSTACREDVTRRQGHVLTTQTGVEIVQRVVRRGTEVRFPTPDLVYGPDFILQFEGARREARTPEEARIAAALHQSEIGLAASPSAGRIRKAVPCAVGNCESNRRLRVHWCMRLRLDVGSSPPCLSRHRCRDI